MKKSKKRQRFTPAERTRILTAAKTEGLTAKQVKSKYGVSTVTYYLWRRKAGLTANSRVGRKSSLTASSVTSSAGLERMLRNAVRERIQATLPTIVRDEVQGYLNSLLAKAPGRKGRRNA